MFTAEAVGIAKAALELHPNQTDQIETAISISCHVVLLFCLFFNYYINLQIREDTLTFTYLLIMANPLERDKGDY